MRRASDALVEALVSEGIDCVHGIPGGETIHLMDSILRAGLRFICCRGESPAAFMAQGASRIHGRPEVCLTTVGPGASSAHLGCGTALLDRVPMLLLTGDFGSQTLSEPHRQGFDQQAAFAAVSKSSRRIERPEDAAPMVLAALRECMEEPPGPVHLTIPMDVMGQEAPAFTPSASPSSSTSVSNELDSVRVALLASKRPLIISGHGTLRRRAGSALRGMARAWGIPVTHSWMGDGAMPWDDPLSLHRIGLPGNFAIPGMGEADLILCVGLDVEELHVGIWEAFSDIPIMHLSHREQRLSPRHPRQTLLHVDLPRALEQLTVNAVPKENWSAPLRSSLDDYLHSPAPAGVSGIHPVDAMRIIRSKLGPEDRVVSDVGAHMLWLADRYPSQMEGGLVISNGMIPMGIALPTALGMKRAEPFRRVVAICGDGGFQMSMAELGTALQEDLPVLCLIWNDSSLGLIGPGMRWPTDAAAAPSSRPPTSPLSPAPTGPRASEPMTPPAWRSHWTRRCAARGQPWSRCA